MPEPSLGGSYSVADFWLFSSLRISGLISSFQRMLPSVRAMQKSTFGSDVTNTKSLLKTGDEKLAPTFTVQRIFFFSFSDHVVGGVAPMNRPLPSPRQPNGC